MNKISCAVANRNIDASVIYAREAISILGCREKGDALGALADQLAMGYKVSVNSFKHGGLNFGERRWFPPFLLYRASLLASDIWSDLAAWHSGCLPQVYRPNPIGNFFELAETFPTPMSF